MSRFGVELSGVRDKLAEANDPRPRGPVPETGWHVRYGWLLIMRERRNADGSLGPTHYRDLAPELTIEAARRVAHEEFTINARLQWILIRQKDFDSNVDRWYRGRRGPRIERDHDLLPDRVRLDAELEDG